MASQRYLSVYAVFLLKNYFKGAFDRFDLLRDSSNGHVVRRKTSPHGVKTSRCFLFLLCERLNRVIPRLNCLKRRQILSEDFSIFEELA